MQATNIKQIMSAMLIPKIYVRKAAAIALITSLSLRKEPTEIEHTSGTGVEYNT